MGTGRSGLYEGLHDFRMGMTQEQGRRSQPVIDVFVAVHVPFARPLPAFDGHWERIGNVAVVAAAAGGEILLETGE